MRRPVLIALSGVLTILCLLLVSEGPAYGASGQPRYVTFVDVVSNTTFRLQVEPSAPAFGAFALRTSDGVLYSGTASGAISALSPTLLVIAFSGSAQRYPAANPANPAATVGAPTAVQVVLQGQISPTQRIAQGQLADGAQIFPFIALGATAAPPLGPTLDTFDQATTQGDWATLYTLMNSEIRAANTQAGFAATMAQASSVRGAIVALRRGASGAAQTNDDGTTSAIVAYALDRQTASGIVTTQYDAIFVLEGGSWRLRYMDEH